MTVIAKIPYKDGLLLVSDSKVSNGRFPYRQKIILNSSDVVSVNEGSVDLSEGLRAILSNDAAEIKSEEFEKVTSDINALLKKNPGLNDFLVQNGFGGIIFGAVSDNSGTPSQFIVDVQPAMGVVAAGRVEKNVCWADGIDGSQRILDSLVYGLKYDSSKSSELEAEVIGYILLKRQEANPVFGKYVSDPLEMCAISKGSKHAFWVDNEINGKDVTTEREKWDYIDESFKADKKREAVIKSIAGIVSIYPEKLGLLAGMAETHGKEFNALVEISKVNKHEFEMLTEMAEKNMAKALSVIQELYTKNASTRTSKSKEMQH